MTTPRLFSALSLVILPLAGCELGFNSSSGELGDDSTAQFSFMCEDRDDYKLEGGNIGVDGVELHQGDFSLTIEEWIGKEGDPGEYIGFVLATSGPSVAYNVKAGGEVFADSGTIWMHPAGAGGPNAPGISNVDFCDPDCTDPDGCYGDPECTDPDGCEGGPGDGGDPECTDPDGCDNHPGEDDPECTDPDGCEGGPGDGGDPECTDPDGCDDGGGQDPIT